jgi:hypothetical protein
VDKWVNFLFDKMFLWGKVFHRGAVFSTVFGYSGTVENFHALFHSFRTNAIPELSQGVGNL